MAGDVLTVREACELLKCSKYFLYRKVKAGAIPARRLGARNLRFFREELLAWLDAQRVTPEPEEEPPRPRSSVKLSDAARKAHERLTRARESGAAHERG